MPEPNRIPKHFATVAKIVVSVALLVALIAWVGPKELLAAAAHIDPWLATLSLMISLAAVAIGGSNILILIHAAAPELPKSAVFVAYVRSWVIGSLAPGRLGDLSLAEFLRPLGVSYGLGLAAVMVDKIISLLVTVAVAAAGLIVYARMQEAVWATAITVAIVGVALVSVTSRRIRRIVRERILRRHAAEFSGFSGYLGEMLRRNPGLLLVNTLVTVVRTVVIALVAWVMLLAVGELVDPLAVWFIQSISQIASWAPISIAGIGVRETAATMLYTTLIDLPAAPVLNAHLLLLVLAYAKAAVLFAVFGVGGGLRLSRNRQEVRSRS